MPKTLSHYTVTFVDGDGERVVMSFDDRNEAWNFMRLCDSLGVQSGFPQAVFA